VAPQLLKMSAVITRINAMRYNIGATNIIKEKDVRLTADECLGMSMLLDRQVQRQFTQQT